MRATPIRTPCTSLMHCARLSRFKPFQSSSSSFSLQTHASDAKLRAMLLYRSTKCGILENDLLLGSFARRYIQTLTPQQLAEYETLLAKENDWDIFKWCTVSSTESIPAEWRHSSIIFLLRKHTQNRWQSE